MVHATIPKGSNSSCNVIASHTPDKQPKSPRIQWIHWENGRWMVEVDGQSWKRRETVDFRCVWQQGHTPVRQHYITNAIDDTAHSKGKELTPIVQHTWCTRNASNSPGTHQKAREQAWKEVPRITARYTSLGAKQAPAIVVNQCAPNSLDNARKWCRAT